MPTTWPDSLFSAPILRGLDAAGRRAVENAGRLLALREGKLIFEADALGDSFFVVERGEVELWSSARGPAGEASLLRVVRAGETFGEEASLASGRRRTRAVARSEVELAEIPMALFLRAFGRGGEDLRGASPEQRRLRRQATADLLRQISLAAALAEADFELLLDAAEHHEFSRGDRIYASGDRPRALWLIAHGLVQLHSEDPDGSALQVRAYLSSGDFFGDVELLEDRPRALTAVAMGACHLIRVSPEAFRSLADRNPDLVAGLRRISDDRSARQAAAVEAAPNSTRHVFADLYRMQMARSLLTIDQDSCVRCGHCAWACEQVHGVARLVRRGDKVVTRLKVASGASELLLPNSCQHCKNPVCMIDCPTGAIGREPEGEVFIREELCTGCGNCAKACPWENIRMAPRRLDPKRGADQFAPSLREAAERGGRSLAEMFPQVANKCDLCRDYEAPACVQSCPTQALVRLEPERDVVEVAALLDLDEGGAGRGRARWRIPWGGLGLALIGLLGAAAVVASAGLQARGLLDPGRGPGLIAGVVAALLMLGLVAHALPKRLVELWMRPKTRRSAARTLVGGDDAAPLPRSRVRPFYLLHLSLGLLLPAAVLAHAGLRLPDNAAGLLNLLAWATIGLGAFGGLAYAFVPRRLTALERSGALPEDLAGERERLLDRLQRELSGKSPTLKTLAAEQLLPWARAPLGWLATLVSGRDLAEERRVLRRRVEGWLPAQLRAEGDQPRARAEALAGLDRLLRTCVELRALPARRLLTATLRAWLGPHVLLTGALLVALVVHVLLVTVGAGR